MPAQGSSSHHACPGEEGSAWASEYRRIQDFYDAEARTYCTERYDSTNADGYVWRARAEIVLELIGEARGLVLDLGSGPAVLAPHLLSDECKLVSADLSMEMLRVGRRSMGNAPSAYWVNCDFNMVPMKSQTVDLLILVGAFGLADDSRHLVAEVARVIRPGGRLILQVSNSGSVNRRARFLGFESLAARRTPYRTRLTRGGIRQRGYSLGTIGSLLRDNGFALGRIRFYDFRVPWLDLISDPWDLRVAEILQRRASLHPFLRRLGEGMVVEATRTTSAGR